MGDPNEGSGGANSEARVKPGPNEAGPSNAGAGAHPGAGSTDGKEPRPPHNNERGGAREPQREPQALTVEPSEIEPPILRAPTPVYASPGPSNPLSYPSPSGSFPSIPSALSPLPDDSIPSVPSLSSLGTDLEVEQPAPLPAEVAPPENNLDELRREIHTLIQERIRKQSDRASPLSRLLPEEIRAQQYESARAIMGDLEIMDEFDPESLRDWISRLREDKEFLKDYVLQWCRERGGGPLVKKGCFGSGVITSDRAKIGGKDKGKSDAYKQSIDSSW